MLKANEGKKIKR